MWLQFRIHSKPYAARHFTRDVAAACFPPAKITFIRGNSFIVCSGVMAAVIGKWSISCPSYVTGWTQNCLYNLSTKQELPESVYACCLMRLSPEKLIKFSTVTGRCHLCFVCAAMLRAEHVSVSSWHRMKVPIVAGLIKVNNFCTLHLNSKLPK